MTNLSYVQVVKERVEDLPRAPVMTNLSYMQVVKERVEDLPRAPVNNEIPDSANVQTSKVGQINFK